MDKLLALTLPGGQAVNPPGSVPKGGIDFLGKVLSNGLNMLLVVAVVLSLFFLIWGGIQWAYSTGDKNKIAAARNRITYAIVGLLVALLAFFLINVVGGIFGVKLGK